MKFYSLISVILLSACSYDDIQGNSTKKASSQIDTSWISKFDPLSLQVNHAFDSGSVVGQIDNPLLDEVSGITASYQTPKTIWVEEDSGNPNSISLLTTSGKFLGDVSIEFVANRDWEDMSISNGPINGAHYIYLADIGDNKKQYNTKYIYRFPEPIVTLSSSPFHSHLSSYDIISFTLPDGIKNCEAVMIDPATLDIYVISKDDEATIYVARYPQPINTSFILEKVGTLPIFKVTAADISPDGTEILIKNYTQIFYWKRNLNSSISSTLKQQPTILPYQIEPQGESICFAADNSGFYTTSEKIDASAPLIYFYTRK
jgi:hypothetical protein